MLGLNMQWQRLIPNETKKLPNISRRISRSSVEADLGNFALLFCRRQQGNVQIFITHVHDHCFCSLNLLFTEWRYPLRRRGCLSSLIIIILRFHVLTTLFSFWAFFTWTLIQCGAGGWGSLAEWSARRLWPLPGFVRPCLFPFRKQAMPF